MLPSNRVELRKFIMTQLGEPFIKVELSEAHLDNAIDVSIDKFTRVAYSEFTEIVEVNTRMCSLPEMRTVTNVYGKHDITKYSDDLPFEWDGFRRFLKILVNIPDKRAFVLGKADYRWKDGDPIFKEQWVREYSVAQAKLTWGQIVGKYSQSIVGGAQINYDRIISEAESEIERLNEELISKWTNIAPVEVY